MFPLTLSLTLSLLPHVQFSLTRLFLLLSFSCMQWLPKCHIIAPYLDLCRSRESLEWEVSPLSPGDAGGGMGEGHC